ncbi:4'-phosphopantetheinyl transferase (enterobactin synthetase component D) [Citrobacter rodentium ICC168]|uniref:Enterobactin synthase component D n=3 Tax=Citrobacter rodentium TaxID=67825 RepID=D2TMM3_CITRI|nr:4'-phosphopantetheinyl transferase (enterobactin synthetase component D) [Citrobacter rodentium ICC168]
MPVHSPAFAGECYYRAMQTTHSPLAFAGHTLHVVTFDPASFDERDLLWLPHYAQLAKAGRKRKSEHLAGRIAAVHALRQCGYKSVPGIGAQRQPLWPAGLFGSISHCAQTALAVVARHRIGVDIEAWFTPQTAAELADSIVNEDERQRLADGELPFARALTLAFSAKESAFKALAPSEQGNAGFSRFQIIAVQPEQMLLRFRHHNLRVQWRFTQEHVITLARF